MVTLRTSEPHFHIPGNLDNINLPHPTMVLEVTQATDIYPHTQHTRAEIAPNSPERTGAVEE